MSSLKKKTTNNKDLVEAIQTLTLVVALAVFSLELVLILK